MMWSLIIVKVFVIFIVRTTANEDLKDAISPNVNQLLNRMQDLEDKITQLHEKYGNTAGGSVYVRWGRKSCPKNGTEMLYWGYVGGSWYDAIGAAANKLCLPSDPVLDSGLGTGGHAKIHGAEYKNTFSSKATPNFDVPCAVCRATSRSSVVMIPSRNVCYPGWTMEYHGIIAAGAAGHNAATEYLCLDSDAEAVNHSDDDDDGSLFYHVYARCTSLPCPPYKESWRFPCVVCSI